MPLPPAQWRKSTHSTATGNNCLEVGRIARDMVALRDSKNPQGPILTFSDSAWREFLNGIKSGDIVTGS